MKIYKENIKRIIQILDEKYNELEDGECFDFSDNKLVKVDNFILPTCFAVRALTKDKADILYEHFNRKYGHTWNKTTDIHYKTFLNFTINDNILYVGSAGQIIKGYKEITADEFIEHIILKNK